LQNIHMDDTSAAEMTPRLRRIRRCRLQRRGSTQSHAAGVELTATHLHFGAQRTGRHSRPTRALKRRAFTRVEPARQAAHDLLHAHGAEFGPTV
jgi:hypothetical protein